MRVPSMFLPLAMTLVAAVSTAKSVAITIDDLPADPSLSAEEALRMTERILEALNAHGAEAIGFVTGSSILVDGQVDARLGLLHRWIDEGMTLGSHSYSHESLNEISLGEYQVDLLQAELLIRHVQRPHGHRLRYFRAPQNHIGPTLAVKDGLRMFLRTRRQRLAPFTVEHSDYAFNRVYVQALEAGDADLAARVESAYLEQLDTAFDYFEGLSERMFDRQIAQVFLIHANRLNAETLDEMLTKLEARGYEFVTLPGALADEAYEMPDHFIGPVGISWFHRWSYSRGFGTRQTDSGLTLPETLYEEPDPPAFILEAIR